MKTKRAGGFGPGGHRCVPVQWLFSVTIPGHEPAEPLAELAAVLGLANASSD